MTERTGGALPGGGAHSQVSVSFMSGIAVPGRGWQQTRCNRACAHAGVVHGQVFDFRHRELRISLARRCAGAAAGQRSRLL